MSKIKKPVIDYTARDFGTIKEALIEYARKYYPNSYQDFNEAGFGSMMLDTVAYTGDILSFYMDYHVNESFLETALERDNVIKLAKQLGYKHQGPASAVGVATFYIFVPATVNGNAPDERYIPVLKKNSSFSSTNGTQFLLTEDVRFDREDNEIAVGRVDPTTKNPSLYAIKAHGTVISGKYSSTFINVGDYTKFLKVKVPIENIVEIISVKDSEGFEYYEVDNLTQDYVYRPITNRTSTKKEVDSFLRPFYVPRRFVIERNFAETFLQFGHGTDKGGEDKSIADPSNVILKYSSKEYIGDISFDPNRLIYSDKFGVVPSNTTLSVVARTNDQLSVNIGASTLNIVTNAIFEFEDLNNLDQDSVSIVKNSIEVDNEEPIIGEINSLDTNQIKALAYETYASQNRAVTREDYRSLLYRMPRKFGSIKRVNVLRDANSFKRNLNIYVLSQGEDGKLAKASDTLKQNMKVWLNENKMINDTIDILDGKILNLGIEFSIIVDYTFDSDEILAKALTNLRDTYSTTPNMGESFFITDIYKSVRNTEGVLDVVDVKLSVKNGGVYSDVSIDLEKQKSLDGRYIEIPDNVVYEIKFPNNDIKGVVI